MSIKKIKNIKTVIPIEYSDTMWHELYARRDKLLRSSDWVLLEDSSLTRESITCWRQWRTTLKALTRDKFPDISTALTMLDNIRAIQPTNVYNDEMVNEKTKMKKLESKIHKLENDIKTLATAVLGMQEDTRLPDNLPELKSYANKQLYTWYNNEINTYMSAPLNIVIERCEQAIDYKVSNDIENSPIVETHSKMTGKSCSEISDLFIQEKQEMLIVMGELDVLKYGQSNSINSATTIKDLKLILETISFE